MTLSTSYAVEKDDTLKSVISALSLRCSVQRTFCHSEELHCNDVRISRKGILVIKPTQDTFVLAWRKKRTACAMRLCFFVKTVSGFCFYKYKTKTRIVRCL